MKMIEVENLYNSYQSKIRKYVANRLVGDVQSQEDLVQETFLDLCEKANQYEVLSDPEIKNLLFNIAHSKLVNHYRKRNTEMVDFDDLEDSSDYSADGPEREVEDASVVQDVVRNLRKLTLEQQEVIRGTILEGKEAKEVGNSLGYSEPAVKMAKRRALDNLRNRLLEEDGD